MTRGVRSANSRLRFKEELKVFSSFQILYEEYVNFEFVFSMFLHIDPITMGKMFYYDIVYLFKRYETYVKEMNKDNDEMSVNAEDSGEMYNEQVESMKRSVESMTKNFQIPKF